MRRALGWILVVAALGCVREPASKEPGATRTASGIVIQSLREGTGASVGETDTVQVHYRGTLADGTEFDSSYSRTSPERFPLATAIPCWREALQRLKVGGKARIVCPPELAYGDRGSGPMIPGGAVLSFEVELLATTPTPRAKR